MIPWAGDLAASTTAAHAVGSMALRGRISCAIIRRLFMALSLKLDMELMHDV